MMRMSTSPWIGSGIGNSRTSQARLPRKTTPFIGRHHQEKRSEVKARASSKGEKRNLQGDATWWGGRSKAKPKGDPSSATQTVASSG
jgi:hypothetical protein